MPATSCGAAADSCTSDHQCVAYACGSDVDEAVLYTTDFANDPGIIQKGGCVPPDCTPPKFQHAVCRKKFLAHNIKVFSGAVGEFTLLAATSGGGSVDLAQQDENTGWQRWALLKGSGEWYNIKSLGSFTGRTFLSTDGHKLDLYGQD